MSLLPAFLAGTAVVLGWGLPDEAPARLASVVALRSDAPLRGHRQPGAARARTVTWPVQSGSGRLLVATAAALVTVGWAGLVAGLLSGVLAAAALGARHAAGLARGQAAERAGALEALAVCAAELTAGRPAEDALRAAVAVARGPLQGSLRTAAAATRLGGDVAAALRAPAPGPATCVPEVVGGLAACWQVCAGTGSGLAAAVTRLEEGLRAEAATRREVDAELAGPRATAALLALLPLAGVGLAAALGARPFHVLLHTPVGAACALVGTGLDLLGLAWTRRTARAAGG